MGFEYLLAEVKVHNTHCSTLYQAGHGIMEGYWTGQAWFLLGESVLWLLLITFISYKWLEMTSRISCSITFLGMRWGWLACGYLALPPCLFSRLEWHWLSSGLQVSLLFSVTFQRWWWVVGQSLLPAPSACMSASPWVPWTCVHGACLDTLWPDPPQLRRSIPFPRLSHLQSLGFPRVSLSSKDWSNYVFSSCTFLLSSITRAPTSFSFLLCWFNYFCCCAQLTARLV